MNNFFVTALALVGIAQAQDVKISGKMVCVSFPPDASPESVYI